MLPVIISRRLQHLAKVVTILLGPSRVGWRGIAIAAATFAVGALIAYVPWHYDQLRSTVPPITTSPQTPNVLRPLAPPLSPCAPTSVTIRSSMKAPRSPSSNGKPILMLPFDRLPRVARPLPPSRRVTPPCCLRLQTRLCKLWRAAGCQLVVASRFRP